MTAQEIIIIAVTVVVLLALPQLAIGFSEWWGKRR